MTFFDLLLNNVLILKKVYKKTHPIKPPREYLIIETGDNFLSYSSCTRFERYFLKRIDEHNYYYLIPYLKEIYNEIPYTATYVDEIIRESKNPKFFKSNLLTKIFNLSTLTKAGQKANEKIKKDLDEIDKKINNFFDDKLETNIHELKQLNGNIFLLKNLNLLFFKKLNIANNNNAKKHFKSIQILFEPNYLFTKSIFEAIDEIFLFSAFKKAEKEYIPGDYLN